MIKWDETGKEIVDKLERSRQAVITF